MKRILSLVLVLILMASVGLAESEFVFNEVISWASSPEEVEAILDGAERSDEAADGVGTLTTLLVGATEYEGLDCSRQAYVFYNDELFMISCYFTKEQLGDTQVLIDTLTGIYGEPVIYTEADRSDSEWMNGIMTRCSWNVGGDTDIYVIQCQDVDAEGAGSGVGGYPYLCYVGFENPAVYDRMDQAIRAVAGE